jgi:hypothetical protein
MEVNWKVEQKVDRLKHQFSQMERDLDLQKILKLIIIPKKKTQWKKVIMKMKFFLMKKMENNWVDGETLHFIALRGKMKLEFTQNEKRKVNFIIIHLFYFQL